MNCSDINSIPKKIDDYINSRKTQKNSENILIKKNYIFSREDFITNDYFLCEIILLLTALSKNVKKYMKKINEMNIEIQELFTDIISKYIEMNSIREKNEIGLFNCLKKDKISKNKNNIVFDKDKNNIGIKEHNKIIAVLNKQIEEIKKSKDEKILSLEKKIKEYENEINKINLTIKEKI